MGILPEYRHGGGTHQTPPSKRWLQPPEDNIMAAKKSCGVQDTQPPSQDG